jgi:putative transposase
MLCRVLAVSVSGYYAWRKREPSARTREDAVLTEKIVTIHRQSRATYGAPRIHAELAASGIRYGRKRVTRLMRTAQLVGCHRRRHVGTTSREPAAQPAPDLLDRQFVAAAPNTKWTADITSIPTWAGFLYLAVVLDVFSRRIVGWAMVGALWALCAPSSCSPPWRWRSGIGVPMPASSTTPTMAAGTLWVTPPLPSASAARRRG